MSVSQGGFGIHLLQVPTAILQLVYLGTGSQFALVREEIGTISLGLHIGCDGIDRVAWHKMMQIQTVDAHIGIVAYASHQQITFSIGWNAGTTLQFYYACTLAQCQIGGIAGAIGLQLTIYRHTWQAIITHQGRIGQSQGKVQILGLGIQGDISLQLGDICYVISRTGSCDAEGGWQMDVEPRKRHVLHISVYRALDADGMVRIVAHKGLWHIAGKAHHILLTYLRIQTQLHRTRLLGVEGVKVHRQLGLDICIRRLQSQLGDGQSLVVHRYAGRQVIYLQTAFLLRPQVPNNKRGVRLHVFNRIDTQVDICKCQMVIIQSAHLWLVAVVVVQASLVPVQTAHFINLVTKVGQHLACHCPTHIGLGIQCVAWQVNHETTLQDTHRIGIYYPFHCRFRGVNSRCIAQGDIQLGF